MNKEAVYIFLPDDFPKDQVRDFQTFMESAAKFWVENGGDLAVMKIEEMEKLRGTDEARA